MRFAPALSRLFGTLTVATLAGSLAAYSQQAAQEPHREADQDARVDVRSGSRQGPPRVGPALAPQEVEAAGGRGKVLVYELDRQGERHLRETPKQPGFAQQHWKETDLELSWAVVTGVIPNKAILKDARAEAADRQQLLHIYRRVELSRQERADDGTWSGWQDVDPGPTLRILDNLPEEDEELVPPEFRLENLVDPLPLRRDGRWSRVNPERFLLEIRGRHPVRTMEQLLSAVGPDELMFRTFDFSVAPGTDLPLPCPSHPPYAPGQPPRGAGRRMEPADGARHSAETGAG